VRLVHFNVVDTTATPGTDGSAWLLGTLDDLLAPKTLH
jgi:hypothetical protein